MSRWGDALWSKRADVSGDDQKSLGGRGEDRCAGKRESIGIFSKHEQCDFSHLVDGQVFTRYGLG